MKKRAFPLPVLRAESSPFIVARAPAGPSVGAPLNTKRMAQLFHALSDETRLRILDRLRSGERCVCELTDALEAAQSRLSFHLRTLKNAGLVIDRREGRWMYYRIDPSTLEEARALVETLIPITAGRAADSVYFPCL